MSSAMDWSFESSPLLPEDRRIWTLSTLAGAVGFLIWVYLSWDYIEDDGFIHMEYARNVASGAGFRFDGRLVFADSSPLWVFLLAGIGLLVDDWGVANNLLSLFAFVFAAWSTASLARVLFRAPQLAITMTAIVLASPYVIYWSMAGMESVLALGVSLWMLKQAFQTANASASRLIRLFALISLAPLIRFELALEVAVIGLWVLIQHRPRTPGKWATIVACGLLAVTPIILWMLYAHFELGSAFPTTSAAKRLDQELDLAAIWHALRHAVPVLGAGYAGLGLGLLGLAYASWRYGMRPLASIPAPAWLLAVWPAVLFGFYLLNRTALQTRYAVLLGGPLLLIVALGLAAFKERDDRLIKGFVVASLLFITIVNIAITGPHMLRKAQVTRDKTSIHAELAEHLPADASIAAYAIGQIAFQLPNPIIDKGALTMPESLPYLDNSDEMLTWVISMGSHCITEYAAPPAGFETVLRADLPSLGWLGGEPYRYRFHCRLGVYR